MLFWFYSRPSLILKSSFCNINICKAATQNGKKSYDEQPRDKEQDKVKMYTGLHFLPPVAKTESAIGHQIQKGNLFPNNPQLFW